MDYQEFIQAYGGNWDSETIACAELLWHAGLLESCFDSSTCARILRAAARDLYQQQCIQSYNDAWALFQASRVANHAKDKSEGRVYGDE